MSESNIENVAMIGAGTLGGQIAWHSAYMGKQVTVYDIAKEGLEKCQAAQAGYAAIYSTDLNASDADIEATRSRLTFTTDLVEAAQAVDLVIEAVPEVPDIKIDVYQQLAGIMPEAAILATNSSTLLPSMFSAETGRPDRFAALHFANMIWALNLAEIMGAPETSDDTLIRLTAYAVEIGMVPIPISKEQNGYVCNSLLVPLLQAAQSLVTKGVADHETVDRTYMIMNRGCTMGPCGIMDTVGMGTLREIFTYWGTQSGDQDMLTNADYIKEHFLDTGRTGLLAGKGYYEYPNPTFQQPDFLDIPEMSAVPALAAKAKLS
ncbi:MAG: 3-hydroxyacyl-CoA dehydrogenase [Halieaceae bacterium]|jgi:3-hydroxyacyl-CoA dehydrogenase|nr:3-hydroxyacyl-CoA dehydrogenase [Halieaceae bacterium]